MFDIEIMMPTEISPAVPKLTQRYEDFKKIGLLNTGGKKVKLVLIVGPETSVEDIDTDFPEPITVEIIKSPTRQVSQKIHTYYANMTEERAKGARWFWRIDDDSLNEVGRLIDRLDKDFDHTREYQIIPEGMVRYVERVDRQLLEQLGHERLYKDENGWDKEPPGHEMETSITSQGGMLRYVQTPEAVAYMKRRSLISFGPGDHAFSLAMQVAKVYPIPVDFVLHEFKITRFSRWGGTAHHIHNVCRDKNNWLFETFLDHIEINTEDKLNVKDKPFLYVHPRVCHLGNLPVNLNANGAIRQFENHNQNQIGVWSYGKNETLLLVSNLDFGEQLVCHLKKDGDNFVALDDPGLQLVRLG